jgi:hypothetical protein
MLLCAPGDWIGGLERTHCKNLASYEMLDSTDQVPNIVMVIKIKYVRWAGHVACIGEMIGIHAKFGSESWKNRAHLRNLLHKSKYNGTPYFSNE